MPFPQSQAAAIQLLLCASFLLGLLRTLAHIFHRRSTGQAAGEKKELFIVLPEQKCICMDSTVGHPFLLQLIIKCLPAPGRQGSPPLWSYSRTLSVSESPIGSSLQRQEGPADKLRYLHHCCMLGQKIDDAVIIGF